MDRKQLKEIVKTAEMILKKYEDNQEAFENFNFKVHGFFYDLWKNDAALSKLGLMNDDIIYMYLDDMYRIFQDEFEYQFPQVEIKEYNRTSARTFEGIVLRGTEWIGSDYTIGNALYEFGYGKNVFEDLQEVLKLVKNKEFFKIFKTLKYEMENDNLDDIVEILNYQLSLMYDDVINFIKAAALIKYHKKCLTVENYVQNESYSTVDIEDLIENKKIKYITLEMLDSMYNNKDYIISKGGHNVKIYTSYAKQPLIAKIVSAEKLLNLI